MSDNPHDALFQFTISSVEHAAAALRSALPAEVAEKIDWSTLAPMPGSFVDAKLDGRRSDLLFSATLAGHPSLLYLLFEHQSYGDELLLLRLLEYMTRIWRAYLQDHPKAKRLPVILPVVLHHSERGWRAATKLDQLLAGDDALLALVGRFVPRYEIVLDDISELDGEALRKRAITALGYREERGFQKGLAPIVRLFERRLGRALSAEERRKLADRLRDEGPEKVGDVVLDLEAAALATWLHGSG